MDNNFDEFENVQRIKRRDLLPIWIKIFCWIFMVGGVAACIIVALSVFGIYASLEFFGFTAANGVVSMLIAFSAFIFNGVAAFLLWTEHDAAINVAKLSAYYGILLCLIATFLSLSSGNFMIRLEFIPLGFFLAKLNKIEYDWANANYVMK